MARFNLEKRKQNVHTILGCEETLELGVRLWYRLIVCHGLWRRIDD